MDNSQGSGEILGEDLTAALKEIRNYIDVTEEDLKTIYAIALRHAHERLATKVPVKDVMTQGVVTIAAGADIHEAARLFSEHRISGAPVVDGTSHVVGVITDADILHMAGIPKGHTFTDILRHIIGESSLKHKSGDRVEDVMTSPAITVSADTDIREAASILDAKRIRRLPVVDCDNRLIGIVSRGDIVRVMAI